MTSPSRLKNHERYVQRTYDLKPGEYDEILARQGGRCAICGKKPRKRYLAVDHDHFTQRVRGLLCYLCNTSLGVWEFDADTARRASEYLAMVADDFLRHPLVEPGSPSQAPVPVRDDLPF